MNVYIFSFPINNFKTLLKSSHNNIESVFDRLKMEILMSQHRNETTQTTRNTMLTTTFGNFAKNIHAYDL